MKTILLGLAVFGIGTIHDVLVGAEFFVSPEITLYGQTFLVLMQGSVISQRFADAFTTVRRLRDRLQLEVEQQTREIKSILKTILQGIFIIENPKLDIGVHRSDHLDTIIPSEISNFKYFLDTQTTLSENVKSLLNDCLKVSIGSDLLNYEVNEHLLPREFQLMDGDELLKTIEDLKDILVDNPAGFQLGLIGDLRINDYLNDLSTSK